MSNNEPQVIEHRKLDRSEEPESDGRSSTTFDFDLKIKHLAENILFFLI